MKLTQWISTLTVLLFALNYYATVHAAQHSATNNTLNIATQSMPVTSKLNINTANIEQLSQLPGIGLRKADAIIAYRELNGEFLSVEEIVNVKGIGPKMLAKIIDKISV